MKLADKVRKILIEVKECFNISEPDNPGTFVRGDGVRYTEWPYIKSNNNTNKIWDKMFKLNPSKQLFVSGEFGSSPFYPAMILKGVLFVKYGHRIEFGDPRRLNNTSIWRSKDTI